MYAYAQAHIWTFSVRFNNDYNDDDDDKYNGKPMQLMVAMLAIEMEW